MATIKTWLLGKHVTVNVTGMTADDTGLLTADVGGAKPFTGKTDRLTVRSTPRVEEISDMASGQENDVILKERWEMVLTEIQKLAGSDIALLVTTFSYFMVVAVVGKKQWTFYCTRGDADFSYEMGKNPASLTFRHIDIGAANPVYAAAP